MSSEINSPHPFFPILIPNNPYEQKKSLFIIIRGSPGVFKKKKLTKKQIYRSPMSQNLRWCYFEDLISKWPKPQKMVYNLQFYMVPKSSLKRDKTKLWRFFSNRFLPSFLPSSAQNPCPTVHLLQACDVPCQPI